jgi:hypothetical protein
LSFWKITSLGLKHKEVSLWFYQKNVCSYSFLVRHYGVAHKFSGILKKNRVLDQNPNGLAFGFTKKHLFMTKTSRKSIFCPPEAHILAQLDIMVLYTNFLRFQKISSFGSKPKVANLLFYWRTFVHDENGPNIYISSRWGLYSILVTHFGVVHKFLGVLKNIEIRIKTQWG